MDKYASQALADRLAKALASGETQQYEEGHAEYLKALPLESCRVCGGTGHRAEAPDTGPGSRLCNGCHGDGKVPNFETHYPFSVENVREFEAFQRYAQEYLQVAALAKQENLPEWQWVQKHFKKLRLHRKQTSGLNIWTCEVTGPRKSRRLHGYLLEEPVCLFDDVPPNNPYLSLCPSADSDKGQCSQSPCHGRRGIMGHGYGITDHLHPISL